METIKEWWGGFQSLIEIAAAVQIRVERMEDGGWIVYVLLW